MPGPGGGARGGGGGRSGFSGGSRGGGHRSGGDSRGGSHRGRSGGGFHGGHPGGPGGGFPGGHPGGPRRGYPRRSPYMGGWYPRPRHYFGGCLSGVASMVFMSILLITLMICLLFSNISSIARTSSNGGGVRYDEEKLQDYADGQYARAFGSSSAYEDNLLLVFLVDETYSDYYYIAWVGDHIATDINYMLGNNQTELGQAMALCINETSYKYSLDSNLAQVMETMTKEIQDLGLETSFKCSEDHAQVRSRLRNDSELDLTEETVNTALTAFTESTGIPAAIVVEDMKDVFETAASGSNSATVLLAVLIVVLGVILVVKFIRRRKDDTDFPSENSSVEF